MKRRNDSPLFATSQAHSNRSGLVTSLFSVVVMLGEIQRLEFGEKKEKGGEGRRKCHEAKIDYFCCEAPKILLVDREGRILFEVRNRKEFWL